MAHTATFTYQGDDSSAYLGGGLVFQKNMRTVVDNPDIIKAARDRDDFYEENPPADVVKKREARKEADRKAAEKLAADASKVDDNDAEKAAKAKASADRKTAADAAAERKAEADEKVAAAEARDRSQPPVREPSPTPEPARAAQPGPTASTPGFDRT